MPRSDTEEREIPDEKQIPGSRKRDSHRGERVRSSALTRVGTRRMFLGVLRSIHASMLMALGVVAVVIGVWLFTTRDATPPQTHHDFAGPTDLSGLNGRQGTLLSIGAMVLGCALLALGSWQRRKRAALPSARTVRDD